MTTTIEKFRTVSAGFQRRIDGCPPDSWDAPTPCDGWTVRDLVAHAIETVDLVAGAAGTPVAPDADDAPSDRWRRRVNLVETALEDPAVASVQVPSPVGTLAFKQVVGGVVLHDLLVHTWDLARATGQDEQLDADIVRSALERMTPFDELLRGPGMFGPKVTPPEGADVQTEFLCFVGRHPA